MSTTTHLGLTLIEQSQAQKEVTVNTALTVLDAILNTGAKDKDLATPPGSPSAGDVYIVAASPTGAWTGQAKSVAYYAQTWQFLVPNEGMTLWVNDEDVLYSYNGSAWVTSGGGGGGSGITALTGDVTASGTGSVAATIASSAVTTAKLNTNAVTYAKLQQASADTLLGNPTGSTANVEEITLGTNLAFSGTTLNVTGTTFVSGYPVITPSISSSQNDWNPTGLSTASAIRVSASAYVDITGLQGGSEGRAIVLENGGSFPIRLVGSSASSSAANRFGFSSNVFLAPGEAMAILYDGTASLWRLVGRKSNESSSYFGTGTDGNVTISSGITRISRDMHYQNLTISGTGTLYTNGFRVFVSEVLDLSAAPALAINQTQLVTGSINGSNASSSSGALNALTPNGNTVGVVVGPGVGASGQTAGGSTGGAVSTGTLYPTNGGGNGASGAGGAGASGSGGSGRAVSTVQIAQTFPKYQDYFMMFYNNSSGNPYWPMQAGFGSAGGGGGGDSTNKGGGGGGGASGGGQVFLSCRFIHRGTNTNTGIISAIGGNGGNGFTPTTGNCGGGGGAGGGGGGWIYLCYSALTGSTITSACDASGGAGGNGGSGVGTGSAGVGGDGGYGGRITLINLTAGTCTETTGSAGTAHSGATGGAGNSLKADL